MAETLHSIERRANEWLDINGSDYGTVNTITLPLGFVVNVVERLDRLKPLEEAYALGYADGLGASLGGPQK